VELQRVSTCRPYFSICIPQYNRTSFLIEACRSLVQQSSRDFEICISDDRSTDRRQDELLRFLEGSRLPFKYRTQPANVRYDANLRASLTLATGTYCFLLGNDDRLASPDTLQQLVVEIDRAGQPEVVITNYRDFATNKLYRRMTRTGLLGNGPDVAIGQFRNFSFVSGVVLRTTKALDHATERWDGSEMYQMYLACRILAEGGRLLGLDQVTVEKDIQLPGERVESYGSRPRIHPCPIVERRLPLVDLGRLVFDAVEPYVASDKREKVAERVLRQVLAFSYSYWVVEYRRVQSWKYSVGFCLGMRLRNIGRGLSLSRMRQLRLRLVYFAVTASGLTIPLALFRRMYPCLYRLAKWSGGWRWREQIG